MSSDVVFFALINVLMAWGVYVALSAGALSFGASAFMAIGCYAAGVLTVKAGWPLIPACLLGAVAAGVIGYVFGFPALRVRGIYLILVTLGIAMSMQVLLENIDYVGGSVGFGGMAGATVWHAAGAVLLVGLTLWWVSRSPLQRVLDAVREDDQVASALGIDAVQVKLMAFAIGSGIAGFAGGLYGHYLTFVRPDTFNVLLAIYAVMFVILGGTNNFWGPALGAAIMTILPEEVAFMREWRPTVFAISIIVLLLWRPQGLITRRFVTRRLGACKAARTNDASRSSVDAPMPVASPSRAAKAAP
ncbi:MAG: branched-chain amino acid ABC transporter permease [Variovorax sp.]